MSHFLPIRPARELGRLVAICLLLIAGGLVAASAVAGAPENPSTGEQSTLVMLVNFADAPSAPFSSEDVRQAFFGSTSEYFREVSGGRTWLAGEVHGWWTLPISATCDTDAIAAAADRAALSLGVDLAGFGRVVYVYAGATGCMASGASSITRYPSRTFLNGRIDTVLVAHELGHAMGLYHSLTLDCDGGTDTGSCTRLQDDAFDVMGSSTGLAYPNAMHQERLGWLDTDDIETAAVDGTVTIAPFESPGSGMPRVLKVFKDLEPGTGIPRWYYIEYRQPLGSDRALEALMSSNSGVLVRFGIAASDAYVDIQSDLSTMLLDMTPGSSAIFYEDRRDPSLPVGGSFVDRGTGLVVTLLWADGSSAGLQLSGVPSPGTSSTPPPATNQPPVAVDDSASVAAGDSVLIDVLGNDSDADGDRIIVVAVSAPTQGTVSIERDGRLAYRAAANARRSDKFTYTVADAQNSSSATVTVSFAKSSGGKTSTGGGRSRNR